MAGEKKKFVNMSLEESAEVMGGVQATSLTDQAVRAEFLRRQTRAQICAAYATAVSAIGVLLTVVVAVAALLL